MNYPIGEWVPCMVSGAQWFMRLRGLERDPEKGLKSMIVSCTTCCQACPLTIMTIDRDHPPDPTYLQKLRPATRERGQLSARSDGSSRSMSPGRCVGDGWDKRGEVTWRTYDDRSASLFSLLSFNGRVPDRMGRKEPRASAASPFRAPLKTILGTGGGWGITWRVYDDRSPS